VSFLELAGLGKQFDGRAVLRDVTLRIEQGETVALLGPSGSGKTTALRILAGLETPDSGRVWIGGVDVTAEPPARRGVGMVFQNFALFPHLSIGDNVAFGLEGRGLARDEIARRVGVALDKVRLAGREKGRVQELSGGMQQRVAVARALAPEPAVLLLDEPFSNLDPQLREATRAELRETIRRVGITSVLVTHEQEEAFDVADRVALLHHGRLEQVGTPEELYERPASLAAGTFVGRASLLRGTWTADGLRLAGSEVVWPGTPAAGLAAGAAAVMLVRPEAVRLAAAGEKAALAGVVAARRFAGASSFYRVALSGGTTIEIEAEPDAARVEEQVAVALRSAARPPVFADLEPR